MNSTALDDIKDVKEPCMDEKHMYKHGEKVSFEST